MIKLIIFTIGLAILNNLLGIHTKDINDIDQSIIDELKIVW